MAGLNSYYYKLVSVMHMGPKLFSLSKCKKFCVYVQLTLSKRFLVCKRDWLWHYTDLTGLSETFAPRSSWSCL